MKYFYFYFFLLVLTLNHASEFNFLNKQNFTSEQKIKLLKLEKKYKKNKWKLTKNAFLYYLRLCGYSNLIIGYILSEILQRPKLFVDCFPSLLGTYAAMDWMIFYPYLTAQNKFYTEQLDLTKQQIELLVLQENSFEV